MESKITANQQELDEIKVENENLRKILNDPQDKVDDEATVKKLVSRLKDLEGDISRGQERRFEIAKQLYEREHEMHMEKSRMNLLSVELGELSMLLREVEYDNDVNALTERKRMKRRMQEEEEVSE